MYFSTVSGRSSVPAGSTMDSFRASEAIRDKSVPKLSASISIAFPVREMPYRANCSLIKVGISLSYTRGLSNTTPFLAISLYTALRRSMFFPL